MEGWARDDGGLAYLRVRVAAPPANGAANAALEKLIAKRLKCPLGAVRIVAGDHGRLKRLEIDGVERAELDRVFGPPD